MIAPRLLAWSVLGIALFSVAIPLFADDECDEPCGSHCGDCAWCPLSAELVVADGKVAMISVDLIHRADRVEALAFARALDHVPLAS